MIFSEVYGSYFKAVSAILEKAVDGNLTQQELTRTVLETAFGEDAPSYSPQKASREVSNPSKGSLAQ